MRRWLLFTALAVLAVLAVLALWPSDDAAQSTVVPLPLGSGQPIVSSDTLAVSEPRLRGQGGKAAELAKRAAGREGPLGIRIAGTVREIDHEDEPLGGVRVRLTRVSWPTHATVLEDFVAEYVTGPDGTFAFRVEDEGPWAVLATKAGYGGKTALVSEGGERDILLRRSIHVRLQVVDVDDRPVSGASVFRYFGDLLPPPVRTDEDGYFELRVTDRDEFLVLAAGYARCVVEEILDRNGAPIVLTTAHPLGGVVVDEAGSPVAGATAVTDIDALPPLVTDATGRFRWDDVPDHGEYADISARAEGYLEAIEPATPGQTDVRLVLARPGAIAGRLVFPRGTEPLSWELRISRRYRMHAVLSDSGPTFGCEGLPPGTFTLSAEAGRPVHFLGTEYYVTAFRGEVQVERLPGKDLEGAEIHLRPVPISHVVSRVVTPEGTPVVRGGHNVDAPWGGATSKRTNADGVIWTAIAVAPGTRTTVSAWAIIPVHNGTRQVTSAPVPVVTMTDPGGEPVEIVLPLDPANEPTEPNEVRLTLYMEREDGAPIPPNAAANWRVSLQGESWGSNPQVTGPGPIGGRWRGEIVIPAGRRHEVTAWADGCAYGEFVLPAYPPGDAALVCRLQPQSVLRGRLVTPRGRPASWYSVRVLVHRPGYVPVSAGRSMYDVDADGRFVIDKLPAGTARISVLRPRPRGTSGSIVAEQHVTIPEGGTADAGDIVIGDLPALRGIVRDAGGSPVGGAMVELFEVGGRESYAQTATQGDGRFELVAPLRNRTVLRVARRYEFAPHFAALTREAFGRLQKVELHPPGRLTVVHPLPSVEVAVWQVTVTLEANGHELVDYGPGYVAEDEHRWIYTDLPIGKVRIALRVGIPDGTSQRYEGEAVVASGGTTTLRFQRED